MAKSIEVRFQTANPAGRNGGTRLEVKADAAQVHAKDYLHGRVQEAWDDLRLVLEGLSVDDASPDPAATVNV